MTADHIEPCGNCQPMYEVDCGTCGGTGVDYPCAPGAPGGDPDWCPACGGCGSDWVPAHPIGEAHA